MAIYNIIYHSKDNESFLWNGSSFDKLGKEENTGLFYSGKTFDENDVAAAVSKSRKAAHKQFPDDTRPQIKKTEIPVNNSDSEGGHRHHMTS